MGGVRGGVRGGPPETDFTLLRLRGRVARTRRAERGPRHAADMERHLEPSPAASCARPSRGFMDCVTYRGRVKSRISRHFASRGFVENVAYRGRVQAITARQLPHTSSPTESAING